MKDQKALKALVLDLERAVARALRDGYTNADCVLTDEVQDLITRINAGELTEPVELRFTAGPSWNFCETRLGDRKDLNAAWCSFIAGVEDWESRPAYVDFVRRFEQNRKQRQ